MATLEIIEIRSHASMRSGLETELCSIAANVENEEDPGRMRVYQHGVMDADFSVHIMWPAQQISAQGSAIGLRLMRALREYGLLHHSVWVLRCPLDDRKTQ